MSRGRWVAVAVVLVVALGVGVWWLATGDDRRAERAREARYRVCVELAQNVDETIECVKYLAP